MWTHVLHPLNFLALSAALLAAACSPTGMSDVSISDEEKPTVSVGGNIQNGDVLKTEVIIKPMPSGGTFEDPQHGAEEWLAIGPVEGKEGTPANGVVQAHFYADGTYILEMQLNIYKANEGRFYQAWLAKEGAAWESIGTLRSHFGDARHQLKFESAKDLREYRKVIITLEVDDGNPEPGMVVAEGELTVRKR